MSFQICPEAPEPAFDFAINRSDIPLTAFLEVVEEQVAYWAPVVRDTIDRPNSMTYKMAHRFHNFLNGVLIQETDARYGANRTPERIEEDRRIGLGHSALSLLVRTIIPDPHRVSDARVQGFTSMLLEDLPKGQLSRPPVPVRLHIAPAHLPEGLFPSTDKTQEWYQSADNRGRPMLFVHYWNTAQPTPEAPNYLEARGVWKESLAAHVTLFPFIPTRTPIQRH